MLNNQAGAVFDVPSDTAIFPFGSEPNVFNNQGTFKRSAGTEETVVNVAFTNSGLVQVLLGRLNTINYTQTATGTLEIGIGGLFAGEIGHLDVTNLATLDGTFKATLLRNFQPRMGDQFQVMTVGSRSGNFASFDLPGVFQAEFVGNVLTLDQTQDPTGWNKSSYASGETATLTVSTLIALGIYQWRAQAFDGRDWSPVSETRTFTLPELPLNTLNTVALNSGETVRYKLNVPQADNLFVTVRSVEQLFNLSVSLTFGAQTVATQTSTDVLLQVQNPQAGEYALEVTSSGSGEVAIWANISLPVVKIGELFTGKVYHNDGYDWTQMDVPEGTKALDLTVEAPGTITFLDVWRGSFNSSEHWNASQVFNPPVRLTVPNPPPGRYYLRVQDHGVLQGSQVREYSIRVAGPQLALSKQVVPGFAAPESELTYTLTYGNIGQAPATGVVIEDTLPVESELVAGSITGGGTYDAATRRITWNIAPLAAETSNQVVTFTAKIKSGVAEGTQVVNTARISSVEQPQAIVATATAVVSSPQISFDNTHTLFDEEGQAVKDVRTFALRSG